MPARPTGWMLAIVLVAVIAWLFVRHVDRLAIAADRWMLTWDRRAARTAALAAKAPKEREHALTVPDQLQRERQPNDLGLTTVAGHGEEPGHRPGRRSGHHDPRSRRRGHLGVDSPGSARPADSRDLGTVQPNSGRIGP
jgi:hypothetical protein